MCDEPVAILLLIRRVYLNDSQSDVSFALRSLHGWERLDGKGNKVPAESSKAGTCTSVERFMAFYQEA